MAGKEVKAKGREFLIISYDYLVTIATYADDADAGIVFIDIVLLLKLLLLLLHR